MAEPSAVNSYSNSYTNMQYTTLGPTDLRVSKICLGTMTYGQQNTEAEGHAQLDYAVERGINFIDTAELYPVPARAATQGRTEAYIGSWLRRRGRRDDLIIATKVAGRLPMAQHIRPQLGFSRASLEDAIDQSLQRLQTDYIDLYQLHWPSRKTNFFGQRGYSGHEPAPAEDDFLDVLQSLDYFVRAGKIRHFGVSNETPWGLMRYLQLAERHGLPRCVSIQNAYSLVNRTFEIGLSEIAMREQVALLVYSPLSMGMLSGKYIDGTDRPENRLNQFRENYQRYLKPRAKDATADYLALARRQGLSLAQMSLAYVNSRPFVTSNIIGATSLEQLRENIDSIELSLSREVIAAIEAIHERNPNPAP